MNTYHTAVLLQETIDYLHILSGKNYIDATLGGGGHTGRILELGGRVLGIDADQDAIAHCQEKFKIQYASWRTKFKIGKDVFLARGNFKDIDTIANEQGFTQVSGIIFDLGVSSYQLDNPERGFSFQRNGPLDMRMDNELGVRARDLVNALGKKELSDLFYQYGEQRFARAIASGIVDARKIKPIETTAELSSIIRRVYRGQAEGIDPATKAFQAIRIAVNDELGALEQALPKAVALLEPEGRLAVISFHSLEDKIVKDYFKELEVENKGKILTEKPVVAQAEEVDENRRSRSAKLRVFEKII